MTFFCYLRILSTKHVIGVYFLDLGQSHDSVLILVLVQALR